MKSFGSVFSRRNREEDRIFLFGPRFCLASASGKFAHRRYAGDRFLVLN